MFDSSYMNWTFGISEAMALAAVALFGYLFGRSNKQETPPSISDDIARATSIAQQLEGIAAGLRNDLAYHRTQVEKFKKNLRQVASGDEDETWLRLREEAELVLGPTLELVGQLSTAYDKIRIQSQALTNYTGSRIDPTTGLGNGKSLEEQLEVLLSQETSDRTLVCSVAMLSIENATEAVDGGQTAIERLGKAVGKQLRGSDFAARYGLDEIVVVMPKTPLSGGCVFGRRLRATIEVQLGLQVSCGVAEALPGEAARALLGRADAALYSARAAGSGKQYLHNGSAIRSDESGPLPCPAAAEEKPEQEPTPCTVS